MATKLNYIGTTINSDSTDISTDIMFYPLEVDSGPYDFTMITNSQELYSNFPTDNKTDSYIIALQLLDYGLSLMIRRVSTLYNKTSIGLFIGSTYPYSYPDYRKTYTSNVYTFPFSLEKLLSTNNIYSFDIQMDFNEYISNGYVIVNTLSDDHSTIDRSLIWFPFTVYEITDDIPDVVSNTKYYSINIEGDEYYVGIPPDRPLDLYYVTHNTELTLYTKVGTSFEETNYTGYLDSILYPTKFFLENYNTPINVTDFTTVYKLDATTSDSQEEQFSSTISTIFPSSDSEEISENIINYHIDNDTFSKYYKVYNNINNFDIIIDWDTTYDAYYEWCLNETDSVCNFYSKTYNNCENIELIISTKLNRKVITINKYSDSSRSELLLTEVYYDLSSIEDSEIVDIDYNIDITDLTDGTYILSRLESDSVSKDLWLSIFDDDFEQSDFNLLSDSGYNDIDYQQKLIDFSDEYCSLLFLTWNDLHYSINLYNSVVVNRSYSYNNYELPGWVSMIEKIQNDSSCSGEILYLDYLNDAYSYPSYEVNNTLSSVSIEGSNYTLSGSSIYINGKTVSGTIENNYFTPVYSGHEIDTYSLQYQLSNDVISYKNNNYTRDDFMVELVLAISRIIRELNDLFPFGSPLSTCKRICAQIMNDNRVGTVVVPYLESIELDSESNKLVNIYYNLNYNLFNRDVINLSVIINNKNS